jgi:D-alanine-D-alanine ligase
VLTHEAWQRQNRQDLYTQLKADLGMPIVVKAPHQGSSIGVAIVQQDEFGAFEKAINQCFFQLEVKAEEWSQLSENDKKEFAQRTANLNEGIGFPVVASELIIYHPAALIEYIDGRFAFGESTVLLSSQNAEDQVLLEAFVQGQEFSCGCIQLGNGQPLALPPTEVIKVEEVFDFNSKYKPGATRKRIPVATTYENNRKIQENIATVFGRLGMNVCARIDGFLTADGDVLLHDPNTIPGMSPTSLIFKQMAEIGLNVTQAITYFIRQSIRERIRTGKDTWGLRFLLEDLDGKIRTKAKRILPMKGILLRDNDTSYAQARLLFSRMSAEGIYQPLPVLKTSSGEYYQLPLPMMFKDYIEDVLQACGVERDAVLTETAREGQSLASWYGGAAEFEIKRLTSFDQLPEVEDWVMVN